MAGWTHMKLNWHHVCSHTHTHMSVFSGFASTSVTNFTAAPDTLHLIYCQRGLKQQLFPSCMFICLFLSCVCSFVYQCGWTPVENHKNVGQFSRAKSVSDCLKCELQWLHTARMANCKKHTAKHNLIGYGARVWCQKMICDFKRLNCNAVTVVRCHLSFLIDWLSEGRRQGGREETRTHETLLLGETSLRLWWTMNNYHLWSIGTVIRLNVNKPLNITTMRAVWCQLMYRHWKQMKRQLKSRRWKTFEMSVEVWES